MWQFRLGGNRGKQLTIALMKASNASTKGETHPHQKNSEIFWAVARFPYAFLFFCLTTFFPAGLLTSGYMAFCGFNTTTQQRSEIAKTRVRKSQRPGLRNRKHPNIVGTLRVLYNTFRSSPRLSVWSSGLRGRFLSHSTDSTPS